jgi:hypothetical protein
MPRFPSNVVWVILLFLVDLVVSLAQARSEASDLRKSRNFAVPDLVLGVRQSGAPHEYAWKQKVPSGVASLATAHSGDFGVIPSEGRPAPSFEGYILGLAAAASFVPSNDRGFFLFPNLR